jgi:hypothetical protein
MWRYSSLLIGELKLTNQNIYLFILSLHYFIKIIFFDRYQTWLMHLVFFVNLSSKIKNIQLKMIDLFLMIWPMQKILKQIISFMGLFFPLKYRKYGFPFLQYWERQYTKRLLYTRKYRFSIKKCRFTTCKLCQKSGCMFFIQIPIDMLSYSFLGKRYSLYQSSRS